MKAAVAGVLKLDELISRTYQLEEINEAFDDLLNGEVARGGDSVLRLWISCKEQRSLFSTGITLQHLPANPPPPSNPKSRRIVRHKMTVLNHSGFRGMATTSSGGTPGGETPSERSPQTMAGIAKARCCP